MRCWQGVWPTKTGIITTFTPCTRLIKNYVGYQDDQFSTQVLWHQKVRMFLTDSLTSSTLFLLFMTDIKEGVRDSKRKSNLEKKTIKGKLFVHTPPPSQSSALVNRCLLTHSTLWSNRHTPKIINTNAPDVKGMTPMAYRHGRLKVIVLAKVVFLCPLRLEKLFTVAHAWLDQIWPHYLGES